MSSVSCVEWENESLRREAARKEITNEQWMCSMSSVSCVEWENESLRREAVKKEITNEQWMCSMCTSMWSVLHVLSGGK